MTLLTRDQILAAQDLQAVDVDVPEWGGAVRVRMMSGTEREAFTSSMVVADGKLNAADYRVRLVAACIIGEDGQRLFSFDDVATLGNKSAAALDRVFQACDKLNAASGKAVDDAEKNSAAGRTGDSFSVGR